MKKSWAAALTRLRPGSVARAESLLNGCVRECADYVAALTQPPGPRRAKLVAAIGSLVAEHTANEPDEDRSFDGLLTVGRLALDAEEVRLARRVADTAVALRSRSKGAWRLRGEALDVAGRDEEALDAYERYEALGGDDKGIARRRALLKDKWGAMSVAGRIVPEARLAHHSPAELPAAFAVAVERRLAEFGAADPDNQRLAAAYGTYTRLAAVGLMDDPLLGGSEPIGVGPLRSQIKGRSACIVSNAEAVVGSGLGEEIDSYDLVVRVDSFRTSHPDDTGERVHLHAVSYRSGGAGWRRKAEIRLVFGDKPMQWRDAIRHRLVPGAQEFVGDKTLSRPVRDPSLIGEPGWAADASTGFTVARLLDFLDVSPRIDLIGFTLPGQLRPEERQWVLAHARHTDRDGLRVSLR